MKKIFTIYLFFSAVTIFSNPGELYNKGLQYQFEENWYGAIEMYQTALQENPSYNLVYQGLAECFYSLNEYEQALSFTLKALSFKQNDESLRNLQGFILIGLERLEEAKVVFESVLKNAPNNADARFGLAEIEIFYGKLYTASEMYKEALFRQSENKTALLSLALISFEAGNSAAAKDYIKQALAYHGDKPQVHYFAAYLAALDGNFEEAEGRLIAALNLKPVYDEADALLASVLYSQKRYDEVIEISDKRIARKRELPDAWYLKTLSYLKKNSPDKAIIAARTGLSIDPENEIMRVLLEEIAINNLDFENQFRMQLSKYHEEKGAGFASRNKTEQALYEYRRALKVYPYNVNSREAYAKLLLRQGYPERYLEQLLFIQTIVKSNKRINDSVEAYSKLLLSSIQTKWKLEPLYLDKRHISVSLFYNMNAANALHPESERISQIMLSDMLSHNRRFKIVPHSEKTVSYKEAFKISRELGDDYFGIVKLQENERDIQLILELYVSKTGSKAKTLIVNRSGNDRFANAVRRLAKMFYTEMPVIGKLVKRYQNEAVIDIGKHDADLTDVKMLIIRKDCLSVEKEGLGLVYKPEDVLGYFEISKAEEDVTEGFLKRNGYYDRINTGDEIIVLPKNNTQILPENFEDSSSISQKSLLLSLLRKIR